MIDEYIRGTWGREPLLACRAGFGVQVHSSLDEQLSAVADDSHMQAGDLHMQAPALPNFLCKEGQELLLGGTVQEPSDTSDMSWLHEPQATLAASCSC